jgi:hypothetical protein
MPRTVERWTRICHAHRTNGDPCRAPAIRGGTVCQAHGGSTPRAKMGAQARLQAFVDPALDALRKLVDTADSDSVRLGAIRDILDRAGYKPREKVDLQVGPLIKTVTADDLELLIPTDGHQPATS